ncbi:serine hydrolase domain-containing protein [Streptomyces yaanensis]|uniref:Serine hydrolase domain-containing protein n=1 Tax=Streptomyces yaanensis TaxID=1142239 RepID=A0ABV7SNQ9_9ACTN|nr:serine hydrolase domain-containing protein [Streptomyces sp. CGMCC 4.7035]WNC02090.1 serine hydrolase domain-containing protein [Streptomyces sp. CGMCC 4.7035]
MSQKALSEFVEATAAKFGIPGVAVGVWADGRETYACHGVTNTENPLPVDQDTLYLLGSVTKTYTATVLMRLVAEGKVELDAPVRRYVPELGLADEETAAKVTVAHLLNHTSGLDWGVITDTGEGDDALAGYVAKMAELEVMTPPGTRASYSQAGFNLAGRVVEKVTGLTYERAVAELLFEPLGLSHSFFARDDIMTRRFAVGHNRGEDGTLSVARLWRRSRGDNPGGGIASSVADQLRWARFHLCDGRAESGARLLPAEVLHRMKEPTVALRASNLGDALGIGWFLRDVDGVRTVGHGGSANGQFAEFLVVPERDFAVVVMSNAGPDGIPFNQEVVRWALQTYLGVTDQDPEPLPYDPARAREIVGGYENDVMTLTIETEEPAGLRLEVVLKPEIRAAANTELPPDHAPFPLGLLPGDTDEYVITGGAFKGQRGFFTRDETGSVVGIDLAGRLFQRVTDGRTAATTAPVE